MEIFYKVGLDKQVWKNINIIQIQNLNKLLEKSNVSMSGSKTYKRLIDTNLGIKQVGKIKIHDSIFQLEFGVIAINGNINHLKNYEKLEFNPSSILNKGINFNPITDSKQLLSVMEIIKDKLKNTYGIIIDFNDAKIKNTEITINIPLDLSIKNYEIPLNFILYKVLKKHKKKFPFHNDDTYNGIYCANGLIELKIYEKNKECGTFLEHDTARVEYKLLQEDKVIEMIGTNIVVDILENFNIVSNSFYESFENDIYNRINKILEQMVKDNLKILNSFKYCKQPFKNYLSSIDATSSFDYFVVEEVINRTTLIENKNHRYNLKKLALKRILEKQTPMTGNLDKLNEILVKLSFKPIVINKYIKVH
ncbi:TPA: hypothetical protein ACG3IS_003745 [Clostridioides difficile]